MPNIIELLIITLIAIWVFNKLKNKPTKSKSKLTKEQIDAIVTKEKMKMDNTINANQFYNEKDELKKRGFETEGIYIFSNMNNGRKYVGQSVNILSRVDTHLRGYGNEDLHTDIKAGNNFTIQFIKLSTSGFYTLNSLEKNYITLLNSYNGGYNKTQGNK